MSEDDGGEGAEGGKGKGKVKVKRKGKGKGRGVRVPVYIVVFKEANGREAVVGPERARDPVGGVDAVDVIGCS